MRRVRLVRRGCTQFERTPPVAGASLRSHLRRARGASRGGFGGVDGCFAARIAAVAAERDGAGAERSAAVGLVVGQRVVPETEPLQVGRLGEFQRVERRVAAGRAALRPRCSMGCSPAQNGRSHTSGSPLSSRMLMRVALNERRSTRAASARIRPSRVRGRARPGRCAPTTTGRSDLGQSRRAGKGQLRIADHGHAGIAADVDGVGGRGPRRRRGCRNRSPPRRYRGAAA